MVRKKSYSVAHKVLIAFIALTGVLLQTGLTDGKFDIGVFRMFTNTSNFVCGIYFAFCALIIAADKKRDGGASPFPVFKGICTMCITLTGIVASAIVKSEFDVESAEGIASLVLHVVTPVMIMADWLIFDTKGRWKVHSPLWWLIAPYIYFIFIMVTAQYMKEKSSRRFPYPFLNYEQMGIPMLILVIAVMTVFYTGIGYLCYLIDRKMGRLEKNATTPITSEAASDKITN